MRLISLTDTLTCVRSDVPSVCIGGQGRVTMMMTEQVSSTHLVTTMMQYSSVLGSHYHFKLSDNHNL